MRKGKKSPLTCHPYQRRGAQSFRLRMLESSTFLTSQPYPVQGITLVPGPRWRRPQSPPPPGAPSALTHSLFHSRHLII